MSDVAVIRFLKKRTIAPFAWCVVVLGLAHSVSAASNPNAVTVRTGGECCSQPKPACSPRTQDEIWCVSTRGLGCPDCQASPQLGYWKHNGETCSWNPSSIEEFLAASDPAKPTVIWIHGNRLDAGYVRSQGLAVYRQLTNGVSGELPIRFVIFSWPSEPTRGIAADARMKAGRTNVDGYYLAWLVNEIDRDVPVNMVGHSFGAKIATGALQLLGGGPLAGRMLPEKIEQRATMKAVLLAAAEPSSSLAIGHQHGEALNAVDKLLAMNNHCDMALKRYPKVECTSALGYTGAYGPLGENGAKLYQIDVCCNMGKSHGWEGYFYDSNLVWQMRPYLGLAPQ